MKSIIIIIVFVLLLFSGINIYTSQVNSKVGIKLMSCNSMVFSEEKINCVSEACNIAKWNIDWYTGLVFKSKIGRNTCEVYKNGKEILEQFKEFNEDEQKRILRGLK